eukprot:405043-Amphidinium_carterae.1
MMRRAVSLSHASIRVHRYPRTRSTLAGMSVTTTQTSFARTTLAFCKMTQLANVAPQSGL